MPRWPWNRRHTPRHARSAAMVPPSAPTSEAGYTQGPTSSWWLSDEAETTPELQWPKNVEVYDQMRRQDAQVVSVLRAVTLPIRRTRWALDANGARDEVVEFVAQNLGLPVDGRPPQPTPRIRDRFSWDEHLFLALTALPFGHSVFEQVYRIEGGRAWLRKLGWRPPRTISGIDVAADGGLIAVEQHAADGKRHRMTVDRLVVYTHEREGGNWFGQSILRAAYKFWLLKDRLLRVQAQSVDRNGMGVPVYEASPAPKDVQMTAEEYEKRQAEEIAAGLKIARGMRSGDSAGAALPAGAKVTLLGVEGTLPDAEGPIRYYDEQIARAVLAHFLNLGTETGSWALGATFANFFVSSLQALAKSIADTTTAHVVEDLVDINFGPNEPAPRVVFDEIGSQHELTAEAIKLLIDCRAITPDARLEQFLRQSFALPTEDPDTARPTADTAPAGGGAPSAGTGGTGSEAVSADATAARYAAEVLQKVYLAVGKVITQEEARDLARRAGASIEAAAPPQPDDGQHVDGDTEQTTEDA